MNNDSVKRSGFVQGKLSVVELHEPGMLYILKHDVDMVRGCEE